MDKKKVFNLLFFGTNETKFLDDISPMIEKSNHNSLLVFTAIFAILLAAVSTASFFIPQLRSMFPIYIIGFTISVLLHITGRLTQQKPNPTLTLELLYAFMAATYAITIMISLRGNKGQPAVTYIGLLIVLPLLICDFPWRTNVLLILAETLFLILSHHTKQTSVFAYDLINSMVFLVIGICTNTSTQIRHFSEFNSRRVVQMQRDTDSLTGTLTKRTFEINIQKALASTTSGGVLMILDIDNFKNINDTFGHSIGDYYISHTGRCLLTCCRESDLIGRFGGDEFVIYMPGLTTTTSIRKKTKDMEHVLKTFFAENTKYASFTASIGCTIFHDNSREYKELFDQADHALYIAKNSGKDKCCIYGEVE